jgi:hypothetical protein
MRPEPDETEIRWLLTEASKYLSPQLKLRRTDVLSAWSGTNLSFIFIISDIFLAGPYGNEWA